MAPEYAAEPTPERAHPQHVPHRRGCGQHLRQLGPVCSDVRMRRTATLSLFAILLVGCAGTGQEDAERSGSEHDRAATTTSHEATTRHTSTSASPDDGAPGAPTHGAAEESPQAAPQNPPVADEPPRADILWRNDQLVPVSGPALVEETLVLYTLNGRDLEITGVAPRNGQVLWSRPATPSVRPLGQGLVVHDVTGLVVHLAPADLPSGSTGAAPADVILRDPATGEEVGSSDQALSHADLPEPCPHDEDQVCVTVPVEGDWSMQLLTPEGEFESAPSTGLPGWTGIGPLGLSRVAQDGTRIGRVVDGALLWEANTRDLFAPGHSTDTGWSFQAFADDSVLVGTVGIRLGDSPGDDPWDLTDYRTVGIDAETGERLWDAPSTSTFCDIDVTGAEDDPLVACLWHSGLMGGADNGPTYRDLDVDLVRLDPTTGEHLWSVPLGATSDGSAAAPPVVQPVSADEVAVTTADGVVVIDTGSGATRRASVTDTRWIEDSAPLAVDIPDRSQGSDRIASWGRYRSEDGQGDASSTVGWPLPPTIGVELDAGRTRVVADPGGLTAFAAP